MSSSSYFCHQCNRTVGLRNSDLACGSCGSEFIEEVRFDRGPPPVEHVDEYAGEDSDAATDDGHGHSHEHPHEDQQQQHMFPGMHGIFMPGARVVHHAQIPFDIGALLNVVVNPAGAQPNPPHPPPPPHGAPPPQPAPAANAPNPFGDTLRGVFEVINRHLGGGGPAPAPQPAQPADTAPSNAQVGAGGAPPAAAAADGGPPPAGQPQGQQQIPIDTRFESLLRNLLGAAVQVGEGGAASMDLGNGIQFQVQLGGLDEQLHANPGDYVFGNMDRIVTQLMNQIGENNGRAPVISDDDLTRLPMIKVNQKHVDNQVQCSTCFDNFNLDEPVAELCCRHIFHRACLEPWLKQHDTCPICRKTIDPNEWPAVDAQANNASNNQTQSSTAGGMMEPDLD